VRAFAAAAAVAVGSIRTRILKVHVEIDPQFPFFPVAVGSIRTRILKEAAQRRTLLSSSGCSWLDPNEDTESTMTGTDRLSSIVVAVGSIRTRILKVSVTTLRSRRRAALQLARSERGY